MPPWLSFVDGKFLRSGVINTLELCNQRFCLILSWTKLLFKTLRGSWRGTPNLRTFPKNFPAPQLETQPPRGVPAPDPLTHPPLPAGFLDKKKGSLLLVCTTKLLNLWAFHPCDNKKKLHSPHTTQKTPPQRSSQTAKELQKGHAQVARQKCGWWAKAPQYQSKPHVAGKRTDNTFAQMRAPTIEFSQTQNLGA